MTSDADEQRTVAVLRDAFRDRTEGHTLDPAVIEAARRELDPAPHGDPVRPSRTRRTAWLGIAAACVLVVAAALTVALVRAARDTPTDRHAAATSCSRAVVTSTLPVWARAGFSADAYVQPHVTGARGLIIGVLFTDPLRSPPAPDRANKILWVARHAGDDPLVITAHPVGSNRSVVRTVAGGPGPSTIDLPSPGCWSFTLRWSGQQDTLVIPYAGGVS